LRRLDPLAWVAVDFARQLACRAVKWITNETADGDYLSAMARPAIHA
jgi:hypothetical protein